MISFIYLSLFVFCFAYSATVEQVEEGSTPPPVPEDVARRELTDAGYVIRHGDALYPLRILPLVRRIQIVERKPTENNEIENEEQDKRRPLFYFTTYETLDNSTRQGLPSFRPYIEIRKKRDVEIADAEIPESSKIGKLRRKRTYCGKCGGGGYSTYYVPVTYVAYPVYYGGYGGHGGHGKGKGCNTCGGHGGGYGGGGGGSFSYSYSSAQSSAGSFGYGKK